VRRLGSAASVALLAVVDIDGAVVEHVGRQLARASFPTLAVHHDLREPLPATLRASFDTVVTDPPYTVAGARLFLARAADALDPGGGDVFFSFGSRRPGAALLVQQAMSELGFAIVRLVRDFNEYVGAGALAGTSSLYHLSRATGARRQPAARYEGPLYTAEAGLAAG
jgi:predicted methyltransferase